MIDSPHCKKKNVMSCHVMFPNATRVVKPVSPQAFHLMNADLISILYITTIYIGMGTGDHLPGHPRSYPAGTELGGKPQTRGAHGKVADEIPDQSEELDDAE